MLTNRRSLATILPSAPRAVWLTIALGLPGLALSLAWISSRGTSLAGWGSFLAVLLLAGGLLLAAWRALRADRQLALPTWLGAVLLGAALLRLAAAVFWYLALPAWGYGSPVEQAGYVMADAEARDTAAWELASHGEPLWTAFRDYRLADQYGGLLFLSALVYRCLGSGLHRPLLMAALSASFSALAVLFTWAFARRAWDERAARLAAWLLALYPEAVLLGSSQMREAYTVTLAAAAFYGLARFWQERSAAGAAWLLGGLALCLPLSPPFAALLLGMLAVEALALDGWRALRHRRLWLALGVLALVAALGIWLSWGRIAPEGISNPAELLAWWFKQSAKWQAHLTRKASGWMQRTFRVVPEWSRLPLLAAYGLVQPFLPAALLEDGIPLWRGIAIWRALGWTALLPFLLAAPLRAWKRNGWPGPARGLTLVVWAGMLLASIRSGGDLWDNPRYRAAFAGLQVALVSWEWVGQRRQPDPWLRRIVVGVALVLAWFIPWYFRRYTPITWPVVDLFKTIGLGLASAFLFALWDWAAGWKGADRDREAGQGRDLTGGAERL